MVWISLVVEILYRIYYKQNYLFNNMIYACHLCGMNEVIENWFDEICLNIVQFSIFYRWLKSDVPHPKLSSFYIDYRETVSTAQN